MKAVGQTIRGKRIGRRAVAQGAIGGALVFAGKVAVARNSDYANLLGRELAAVGSSGIQNAAAGRGFIDHLSLPWGPVRFHIDRLPRTKVSLKLDLAGSVATIIALVDNDLAFDVERSLINGVAVFEVDSAIRSGSLGGSYFGGVVKFRSRTRYETAAPSTTRRTIGHELVHVVQSDFQFNALAEPAETYALGMFSVGRVIHRYVDLGLNVPLASALNSLGSYERRPWEREAFTLAGGSR